jgi:hypothetical protein
MKAIDGVGQPHPSADVIFGGASRRSRQRLRAPGATCSSTPAPLAQFNSANSPRRGFNATCFQRCVDRIRRGQRRRIRRDHFNLSST